MALWVEVDSVEKGCRVMMNMDEVTEIAPFAAGGCHLFLNDGRIYKVKDSYEQFKQFAILPVSAEDIAKRFPKKKEKPEIEIDKEIEPMEVSVNKRGEFKIPKL